MTETEQTLRRNEMTDENISHRMDILILSH